MSVTGSAHSPDAGPEAAPRTRGVLVADDTAAIRDLLDRILRRSGFAVWLADDGAAAVETFRRHWECIDVILLDVRMPVLDGPQALAAIRRLCPHVPCCFMSGHFGDYSRADLLATGAAAVLPKPFRLADVVRTLDELAPAYPARR